MKFINIFQKSISRSVAISFFILLTNFTSAQHYHFDNYSVKEGLAQSGVYAIIQDRKGKLWLGTASGLSAFDGKEFTNFSTEDGLAEGGVKSLALDTLGNLWVGHEGGGISLIQQGKASFIFNFQADITSFSFTKNGDLWIGTYKGGAIQVLNPYETNKDSLKIKQYKGQDGLSDIVYQVLSLKNGNSCFVTDVGIKQYQPQKDEFSNFQIEGMSNYFQITCMYEASNGDLWLGTYNGGLYRYTAAHEFKIYDFVRDGIASNWITTITEDLKGNCWIGTWGGGISMINDSEIITINTQKGLPDNNIRCFSVDREGNLLIGSKETGLLIFKGFQLVSYGKNQGLLSEQTKAIQQDKNGDFWIGTGAGISVFSKTNDKLTLKQQFNENNGLFYTDIRFIKKDKNDNLWIGTWGGGILEYNYKSKRFQSNYRINAFMSQPFITALEVDKSNNLWVGTTDGLVYYEVENQLADRLSQSHGLGGNDISCLYTDKNNVLWVGAKDKGLSKIDGAEIQKIKLEKQFTAVCMIEDSEGNLWIGTNGKGILVFNGKKIIQEITVADGMLSNYISFINIDNEDNIWIGTNKGLNKNDKKQQQFYTYTNKMGYKGIESKLNATYKDNAGDLWFGTIEGLIHLNKRYEQQNLLEPITFINKLMINLEERALADGMELSYREKAVAFYYNSICMTNPEAVNYKYMLEGLDEDWRPITKQTFVTYSPLPPGNYTFKVIASNNNGVWNTTPTTYNFVITPPFWQQWWFIVLCVVILVITIVVVIKFREKALIKEKHVLEEKVKERTAEVVQKSKEVEMKNKDIIDSINYAKRIQDAILPSEEEFSQSLKNTFVLFNPKDIVSGDFYWMQILPNSPEGGDVVLFAAADCTGHGVPGAFMSIVGHNLLDKIVGEYRVTSPAEILNYLNKGVSETLRQSAEQTNIKDGMDISLCVFNTQTKVLEFAGAYNPLYIVSQHNIEGVEVNIESETGLKLYEVKADRFPIGNYTDEVKQFTNHSFNLNEGDTVYLFSDGYADQFGGTHGKKFRYKQFKELLLVINSQTMEKQKEILQKTFTEWKGELEQIDDVIIIGSKVG
ncbi:MAG: two-component regulator propeller domain-containing protein [Vicingaceae bacterium]|nr:two-component regulator propeller domain-containing protein [Vicingaceae bacterium]